MAAWSLVARARVVSASAVVALLLLSADALADRVASLGARGTAPLADRTAIKQATDAAAKGLGHELVPESDVLQGEAAAGAKAGTSEGCVAIGQATSADWVVEPTILADATSGAGTHVEMKACQVSSGRVETLARDLDPEGDRSAQLREMLALLLRPQGVGDDPLPWKAAGYVAPKPPAEAKPAKPAPAPAPSPTPPPTPPPQYGEGGPLAIGGGGGAAFLLARPDGARGGRVFGAWHVGAAFGLPQRRGLELLLRVGGVHGSANGGFIEVGGRLMFPGSPTSRLAFGGAATVGAFGVFSSGEGIRDTRVSIGATPVVAWVVSRRLQIDVELGAFRVIPGEGGALVFGGTTASAMFRF